MSRTTFLPALALCVAAGPALAGGYEVPAPAPIIAAPPPAPVVVAEPDLSWTGKSVGIRLGYGHVDGDDAGDDEGVIYGFGANYDVDFGSVVAGAGISVDKANIDLPAGVEVDYIKRIGGRLGVDLGASMIYGTGGYAKVWTDGADVGDSDGYYAGIGGELRLSETLSLGSEILYHEFDDFDADGVEVDALTSNLSLNLRF